jgi:hypothetical protein
MAAEMPHNRAMTYLHFAEIIWGEVEDRILFKGYRNRSEAISLLAEILRDFMKGHNIKRT